MNSLFQQLNPAGSRLSANVKNIIAMFRGLVNPQSAIQQMPQYKEVMDYINANGGDAKTAFYKRASEMGVDPNEILKQLK